MRNTLLPNISFQGGGIIAGPVGIVEGIIQSKRTEAYGKQKPFQSAYQYYTNGRALAAYLDGPDTFKRPEYPLDKLLAYLRDQVMNVRLGEGPHTYSGISTRTGEPIVRYDFQHTETA